MDEDIRIRLIRAIADADGSDPADLDYAIEDHVNTDAIQLLFDHEDASWTLSYELPDRGVTISSDGVILVDGVPEGIFAVEA